jgi:hypothetical protein
MEKYPTRGSERLANKAHKNYKDGDSPTQEEINAFDDLEWRAYELQNHRESRRRLRTTGSNDLYGTMSQVYTIRQEEEKEMKKDCDDRFIKSAQRLGKCGPSKAAGQRYLREFNKKSRAEPNILIPRKKNAATASRDCESQGNLIFESLIDYYSTGAINTDAEREVAVSVESKEGIFHMLTYYLSFVTALIFIEIAQEIEEQTLTEHQENESMRPISPSQFNFCPGFYL